MDNCYVNSLCYNEVDTTRVGEGEQKLHRRGRKTFGPLTAQMFFKDNNEGDMTRGVGNVFQYLTTRTENAPLLRRRRFGPCSNL